MIQVNQLNYNIDDSKIENLLGFFGAYLSSYSLIFIGTLSYLLAFFIILEGAKLFGAQHEDMGRNANC